MRILLSTWATLALASCAAAPQAADPDSDAPEHRPAPVAALHVPATYAEALGRWREPGELNAWIGARFRYDQARALRLSETQRSTGDRIRIIEPATFYADPSGVCVDLARFAVETMRAVAPGSQPMYLMIEFDPVMVSGNLLRRHWLAVYEREGKLFFFADSKRPGHVAGPYDSAQQFIDEYARYRGRHIASFRSLDSYERARRKPAPKAARQERAG